MKKLAIIITHPIQYYAPLFKLITERKIINIKVFYTWSQSKEKFFDNKFQQEIKWDIPLLSDYSYQFVNNISSNPGSGNFLGVINPSLIIDIEKWETDAVLVFGWNHHSHLKVMRYFKGKVPVLFRGDSTLIDEKKEIRTLIRRIWLKKIYKSIDFALYAGIKNKEYFIKHGIKNHQLKFVPHAIDNKRFSDNVEGIREKALERRKELGFTLHQKIILFAGKFENKKNPEILLDALDLINEKHSHLDLKILFVGNGPLEHILQTKAIGNNNIQFLPFQNQSQMPLVYHMADIFCLPSKGPGETWGLAVNEAMVSEKPVIVSDKVGCAIDLVKNGLNGFIFRSGSCEDLAQKIIETLKNIDRMGLASKEIISSWNFESMSMKIESVVYDE